MARRFYTGGLSVLFSIAYYVGDSDRHICNKACELIEPYELEQKAPYLVDKACSDDKYDSESDQESDHEEYIPLSKRSK